VTERGVALLFFVLDVGLFTNNPFFFFHPWVSDMTRSVGTLTVLRNFVKLKDTHGIKLKFAAHTMKRELALMAFDAPLSMNNSPWQTQIFITLKKHLLPLTEIHQAVSSSSFQISNLP
jgi:hypothetical protein